MIDKKSIIKMAEHVFRKSQGYPDRRLMHPKREWGIGIGIFLVLVSAGAIGAFSVFTSYRDFSQVTASVEQSIPTYREVIVQDALEVYRQKEQKFTTLRQTNASSIVDNSVASTTSTDQTQEETEQSLKVETSSLTSE